MKRRKRIAFWAISLTAVTLFAGGFAFRAQAKEEKSTIHLKMICTTDIHGQITSKDQASGISNVYGGMEKMYTVIKQEREKATDSENCFTFDCGDILADYTTQVIYDEDETRLQPVFEAYKKVGYDAFVLGNHEFDFGFSYIKNQIEMADLSDRCVVSNLTERATGEYPFLETLMLDRTVTAEDGTEVAIRVGIIGETTPSMSGKTEVLSGAFRAEDIIANATKKAKKLKEAGADIVVVLAHSGFGEPEPKVQDDNVSYALTKVPNVDVIFAGHQHKVYPDNPISDHYSYESMVTEMPGVDKTTKLVNGKPLLMAGCRGDYVGVIDLKCELEEETLRVVKAVPRNIKVNPKLVKSAPEITESFYGGFLKTFSDFSQTVIAKTDEDITYHNYYAMLKDSDVNQLLNNAKISHGLAFINSRAGKEYKGYPVIGSSAFYSYGYKTGEDYIDISGEIKGADIAVLQYHHVYLKIYKITGKQLKEYMEWTAAGPYTTNGTKGEWPDPFLNAYHKELGISPLVYPDWLENWSRFRVFDGVEYKIDPSVEPRYDLEGNPINDTHRIVSLTRNGVPVKDDDVFIMVSDKIFSKNAVTDEIISQMLQGGYVSPQKNIIEYLKESYKSGPISIKTDNNWSLVKPEGELFLLNVFRRGDKFAVKDSWMKRRLISDLKSNFYIGNISEKEDTEGPELVAAKGKTIKTNDDVVIAVQASDGSGVKEIRYVTGNFGNLKNPSLWQSAGYVNGDSLTVKYNGVYNFMATDGKGNVSYTTVTVDNIDRSIVDLPDAETYTNRKGSLKGYADPYAKITVTVDGNSYKASADEQGRFACKLPFQRVGKHVTVVAENSYGKRSEKLALQVKRTGPNKPVAVRPSSGDGVIEINAYDADAVPVIVFEDVVYGSEDALAKFRASERYRDDMEERLCDVEKQQGNKFSFYMTLPKKGKTLALFTVDSLGRASAKTNIKIK